MAPFHSTGTGRDLAGPRPAISQGFAHDSAGASQCIPKADFAQAALAY